MGYFCLPNHFVRHGGVTLSKLFLKVLFVNHDDDNGNMTTVTMVVVVKIHISHSLQGIHSWSGIVGKITHTI